MKNKELANIHMIFTSVNGFLAKYLYVISIVKSAGLSAVDWDERDNWRSEHECDATSVYPVCLRGVSAPWRYSYFSRVTVRIRETYHDESDAEARTPGLHIAGWTAFRNGRGPLTPSQRGASGADNGVPAQIRLYRIHARVMSFLGKAEFAPKSDNYWAFCTL